MKIKKSQLHSIIKQNLFEADAYTRKFGKRYDQTTELEKYVDVRENGICKYAIRMMGGMQMGINQGYRFRNPRGIYCYPLTREIYEQLVNDELPYVSKAEHIVVFELQRTDKWLDVSSNDKYPNWLDICRQMTENAKKMTGKIDQSQNIDFDQILRDAENEARHWDFSDGAKIYDFGFFLKQFFVGKVFFKKDAEGEDLYRDKQAVAWQKFLQSVGFIGVYDEGGSILHTDEPTQLVALQVDALKTIKFYKTKTFRKSKSPLANYKSLEEHLNTLSYSEKFKLALSTKDPKILIALSKDNTLSTYENFYIRKNIAMNQNTPPEAFIILAEDPDPLINQSVAENSNAPSEALIKILEKNPDGGTRASIAYNKNTPLEALITLSKDPDEYVRGTVAQNPTYIKYLESNKSLSERWNRILKIRD
jgi:hypothetical protein